MVGLSALGAAFAPGAPTGTATVDLVMRMAFAAGVTLAASRARRWTLLVLAGLAALGADGAVELALAGGALVAALLGVALERRRIYGAVTAALGVQILLRLPDLGFVGSSSTFALVAVAPTIVSGYQQVSSRARRRIAQVALVLGGFAVVAVLLFGVVLALAWENADRGVNDAKQGLAAVGDAKSTSAMTLFDDAQSSLSSASGIANAWWTFPTRLVPGLAQHASTFATVTEQGADLAATAGRAAQDADVQTMRYESGQIDLARVRAAQEPLADAVSALETAQGELAASRSPWLVAPVADRLSSFSGEVDSALDESRLASLGVQEAPGLLGGDGPRNYFVIFTQPAEARGLGGFMGGWAVLTATNGKVELTASGRAKDLNDTPGRSERSLTGPTEYLDRYGRFRPEYYFQDVTFSPDLPSVAEVVRELYPQAGGVPLDGVMAVDPDGIAALLDLTGPIKVNDLDVKLNKDNAAQFLLRDQYTQFADRDLRQAREDVLEEVGRMTFDKLVTGSLPSPGRVGDVLAPAVAGRHLMFQSFRPAEQSLFTALGAGGSVSAPGPDDYLSLVTQNKGNNKIDVYLHRSIDYQVDYDPSNGKLEATVTVTLHNDAPSSGLPESVIGSNDQGLPPGTNALFFSLYTPHHLKAAKIDGETQGMEFQREFGYAVYSRFVEIPPGGTVTVTLELEGRLAEHPVYSLKVDAQPVPNPDDLRVGVDPTAGWAATNPMGFGLVGQDRDPSARASLDESRRFRVRFVKNSG